LSIASISQNKKTTAISDVIWLQTSFIGDIVLTTAAMTALHQARPDIRQHMITTAIGAQVLSGHPCLASIHIFAKRDGAMRPMLKVRNALRQLRLKSPVILQPHKSLRSTILSKVIGYPIVTYNETTGSFLATTSVPRVAVMHESDRIGLLLEGIGLNREAFLGKRPTLPAAKLPQSAALMSDDINWIGIAPGSVWATKRWPSSKFATLCQLLLDQEKIGIVLLGSKDDAAAAGFIEETCLRTRPQSKSRLLNLTGQTSLKDLNGIYPRLTKLISNDSSPIHYASAFNIPTIAIFGATVASMGFGPLADGSAIAEITLDCRPCSDHGPQVCPLGHFKCMNELNVDRVLALAIRAL
jgi:heptosyltransferase-2